VLFVVSVVKGDRHKIGYIDLSNMTYLSGCFLELVFTFFCFGLGLRSDLRLGHSSEEK